MSAQSQLAASQIFEFERDFAHSLRCIPMSVRLKLDCCGVKVSLRQWSRLTSEERAELLQLACEEADRQSYRQRVVSLVQTRSGQPPDPLPVESEPAWEAHGRVPQQLVEFMTGLQLPPLSVAQWSGLEPLQRFALLKLSRPGHENDNFLPALREFGLLSD